MDSLVGLMAQAKAMGTINNYENATKKFQAFCEEKKYKYPAFSEKAVLHFIIQQDSNKMSLAGLSQIKPALILVEQLAGTKYSAFTDTSDILLTAAKRRAAEIKPPVRKAGELPDNILHMLHPVCFLPFVEESKMADPAMLRTYVRDVIVYFTFCRLNCYSKLRAMDLEDSGTGIQINFRSAKNDQFHNGRMTCLVSNGTEVDPVYIVRTYFRWCGFKFRLKNGDNSLLNCVMRRTKTGWIADGRRGVSYSTATKNVRTMVTSVGEIPEGITDKSFKMKGVTRMLHAGVSTEDVAQQGHWETTYMPLYYKHNSVQYKESLAGQVPI